MYTNASKCCHIYHINSFQTHLNVVKIIFISATNICGPFILLCYFFWPSRMCQFFSLKRWWRNVVLDRSLWWYVKSSPLDFFLNSFISKSDTKCMCYLQEFSHGVWPYPEVVMVLEAWPANLFQPPWSPPPSAGVGRLIPILVMVVLPEDECPLIMNTMNHSFTLKTWSIVKVLNVDSHLKWPTPTTRMKPQCLDPQLTTTACQILSTKQETM